MKKRSLIKSLLIPLVCIFNGCDEIEEGDYIYASFYPIYEFASLVAGDCLEVRNLNINNQEPHEYEPTVSSVKGMLSSKVVLINGLGLENWVDEVPNELGNKIKEVTSSIEVSYIDGEIDPHVWLDPNNVIIELENIRDILSLIDEENASTYALNCETAIEKCIQLDEELKKMANQIENKLLVVSHAAFGYLCSAYGLDQVYVSGLSSSVEPSAKAIEKVIELVKENDVKTIYYEEYVSSSIAEKISKETGCNVATLNPIEVNEDDSCYFDIMKENMQTILEGNS